jgi:hypothetical protein
VSNETLIDTGDYQFCCAEFEHACKNAIILSHPCTGGFYAIHPVDGRVKDIVKCPFCKAKLEGSQ